MVAGPRPRRTHYGRSSARSNLAPCRDFSDGLLGDKNSKFFPRRIRLERRYCNNNDVFIAMSGLCAPKPFILTDSHCCTLMFCFLDHLGLCCCWQGSWGRSCIVFCKGLTKRGT